MNILNQRLVEQQGLSPNEELTVLKLHDEMIALIGSINVKNLVTDLEQILLLTEEVKQLEFKMQRAWKFSESELFHHHYLKIRFCKCPVMDNMERLGYQRITNMGCPIHISNFE